jgi:hypothetical protein
MEPSPSIADLEAFIKYFTRHTDRGAALAAVANLDHILGEALKARLVDDIDVVVPLFRPDSMFGGYGARVRLAYITSMIKKGTYQDLIKIGDIRNAFAHRMEHLDFNNREIKGKCSGLKMLVAIRKGDEGLLAGDVLRLYRNFVDLGFQANDTSNAFLCCVFIMTMRFHKVALIPRAFSIDPF